MVLLFGCIVILVIRCVVLCVCGERIYDWSFGLWRLLCVLDGLGVVLLLLCRLNVGVCLRFKLGLFRAFSVD